MTRSELPSRWATATREQALEALIEASLAISSKLSLEATLQQIADSARHITDAEYAAIAEFSQAGDVEAFITSGLTPEQVAGMPHKPKGLGLLRAVVEEKRSIRIPSIEEDARSYGFPPNHPGMKSFLGVPIMAGSTALGNLYLTNKRRSTEFTQEDQEIIELLAGHAAIAIENARLYEASQSRARELKARNRELAAVNAIAKVTSEHLDLEKILERAVREVLEVTGMEAGEVFLLDENSGALHLVVHVGEGPDAFHTIDQFEIGQGIPGKVAETGIPRTTMQLSSENEFLRQALIEAGFQTYACLPIRRKGAVIGTMGLASRQMRTISTRDLSLLEAIGHQVGTAIENSRLYEEIERLAILEERSRIGMDLHDGVIQSIYAVGLTLETTRLLFEQDPEQAGQMLDTAVIGLNDAIRDIRNFILDLRPHRFEGNLSQGIARLVREFQANTMVEVDMDAPPALANSLPPAHARSLFLTAQEALANIARHARASKVLLSLEAEPGEVRLTVKDNGKGFDPSAQSRSVGHGLANMHARAEELGGVFLVHSMPGEGTTLQVSLPRLLATDPAAD